MEDSFGPFRKKMDGAGLSAAAVGAFERNYGILLSGETTLIPEGAIEPARGLPALEEMASEGGRPDNDLGAILESTVVIKLNGGLGTGMGLEKAKSLLVVREDLTFLDLIARQILGLRRKYETELSFLLMNSYTTSGDTLKYLEKYPDLGGKKELELMQSRVPKIDAETLRPVDNPDQRELEWCPPGHGDLYPSLLGTGWLDLLLARGVSYAFVSNSDNLGATLDPVLLKYFARSGKSFLMEVTPRTAADRKGGHLATDRKSGRFLLRESAQCEEEDVDAFQDIEKHCFFNTNNLWVRLDRLKATLEANQGILPLPMIKNRKTVDPRDKESAPVYQLETAMGAAIECFDDAGAIVVPRSRFAPVKTTDDLLALRSDAFRMTDDFRLELDASRSGIPPVISLDAAHYKLVDQLEESLRDGIPSLVDCEELRVVGAVSFHSAVTFKGVVTVENASDERRKLPSGVLEDETIAL